MASIKDFYNSYVKPGLNSPSASFLAPSIAVGGIKTVRDTLANKKKMQEQEANRAKMSAPMSRESLPMSREGQRAPMTMVPRESKPIFSGSGSSNLPMQGGGFSGGGSAGAGSVDRGGSNNRQLQVPSQWMREDGSFYSPDEIAEQIASSFSDRQGMGDVGNLAADQFSGREKSAAELATDTRNINNTRNDIATGETDPYKIASQSGIAYTPAELKAIEDAAAGVYNPALNSAMSKLEDRQATEAQEREMRLQADLEANAPYTLGKDQIRYDGQGNPIAVGFSDSGSAGSGVYSPGSNPTVDAYVSGIKNQTLKMSDVPEEYKGMVAQGMAATPRQISQSSREAINVIDQLLGTDTDAIAGIPGVSSIFSGFGTDASISKNLAKQLNGMLKLENREQLKGSGAISDFEFRVLGDAASSLGINENGSSNLSNKEFVNQLNRLKLKLEVGETTLPDDEIMFLYESGYSPEEIREAGNPSQVSFNSVGNTTASGGNRPQRNNNPGNVKSGGLADSLAIGTDDQGHLVFPDTETGFKALAMDVTAKVNGASRHLPPNPTIRQLGKVYAEDPDWPIKVAGMLGVSADTPTQTVPINKLVEVIARQEGFYA